MNNFIAYAASNNNQLMGWGLFIFFVLLVWSLIWKGIALWKAARRDSLVWFIVILAINTVGILDIIYYFFVDNQKPEK